MLKLDVKNGLEEMRRLAKEKYEAYETKVKNGRNYIVAVIAIFVSACVINYLIDRYAIPVWAHELLSVLACFMCAICLLWGIVHIYMEYRYMDCKKLVESGEWLWLAYTYQMCPLGFIDAEKLDGIKAEKIVKTRLDTKQNSFYISTEDKTFVVRDVEVSVSIPTEKDITLKVCGNQIALQESD